MKPIRPFLLIIGLFLGALITPGKTYSVQDESATDLHLVEPGDTWNALAWRYGLDIARLHQLNPQLNQQRQPAIGSTIIIPAIESPQQTGTLFTGYAGGLWQLAASHNQSPWAIAQVNSLRNPYQPTFYKPIFIPGGQFPPRQLPFGVISLELSPNPPRPGQALAIRGVKDNDVGEISITLEQELFILQSNEQHFVALLGTGAFYPAGSHELNIQVSGEPLWTQPWQLLPGEWTFEEITLTGSAAAIDAESIRLERERLTEIWTQVSPEPLWTTPFDLPIEQFLEYSSFYGARRSYNGGPYRSYHEGLDFSAYGGTPVMAVASGRVVIAEQLYVRGGAVIIDHGLGIYSGTYHMSEVLVSPGEQVVAGQLIGRVGSTGLSTGNHLHWDLLINGVWVDPGAWLQSDQACWILEGWGKTCLTPENDVLQTP